MKVLFLLVLMLLFTSCDTRYVNLSSNNYHMIIKSIISIDDSTTKCRYEVTVPNYFESSNANGTVVTGFIVDDINKYSIGDTMVIVKKQFSK